MAQKKPSLHLVAVKGPGSEADLGMAPSLVQFDLHGKEIGAPSLTGHFAVATEENIKK